MFFVRLCRPIFSVFYPKKFSIINLLTNFTIKDLGLNGLDPESATGTFQIQQQLGSGSGFSDSLDQDPDSATARIRIRIELKKPGSGSDIHGRHKCTEHQP
jgi:hypothetical protein